MPSLRPVLHAVIAIALWSSLANAQPSSRDAAIDRIVAAYTRGTVLSADSPFLELILGPAKSANPGVSKDTWSRVKMEVATAVSNVITEKGGMMDTLLRSSLASLSSDELERLGAILDDPVYKKFQAVVTSPATQQVLARAMLANAIKMNAAINSVLARHGLTQVH